MAGGLSAVKCTGYVFLRFIQSNLQRSRFASAKLFVEAERRKIAVDLVQESYVGNINELRRYSAAPRREPVKAVIIILDSSVDVEEDQTLV
ncbi:hypothetical protein EVAR_14060_1 [Eumeta japonica]|uniref:Uncharacterized protein n=1 Tax=Eumeta variegata TaxID=151549 RepID=A0A4C1UN54_EUMVA|nr:hypothetical protein EVAR_14060_1 [Eumeta japonica]